MRTAFLLLTACALASCRDVPPPAAPRSQDVAPLTTPSDTTGATGPITGWLRTSGNHIVGPDGRPFHGRGANIHDTRSCDSCSWEPPHVDEVLRRIDTLVDGWHANFVRLLLESYGEKDPPTGKQRTHYRTVLDDEEYFRDVMRIVGHIGKKRGVYVLISLWHDPTLSPLGWPTERTRATWKKLAGALRDMPFVMFGLVNEPQSNSDGKRDAEVWTAMNDTVATIRSVERTEHTHIVTVQGTRDWARVLDYYVDHPITAGGGVNIAYETHVYDRKTRFASLVEKPAKKLPVVIGEMGVVNDSNAVMTPDDCTTLMDLAEKLEVPWLAYTFHTSCPPNLLVDHAGTCGVGVSLDPSPWGLLVKERLAHPW